MSSHGLTAGSLYGILEFLEIASVALLSCNDRVQEFQIFARFSGASPTAFYKGYALNPQDSKTPQKSRILLLYLRFGGAGVFITRSKNRNDLCFLYSKNQQKNTKKKNKSKSKRYQNTHRFSSSLFSFLYLLIMMYSAAQSKHATIKSRLILPDPKLS